MKKIIVSLSVLFCIISFCFSQGTTYSAGMKVPEDRIRTQAEGEAALAFRLGVQAYYKEYC